MPSLGVRAMEILPFYKYFNQYQNCCELTCAANDWIKKVKIYIVLTFQKKWMFEIFKAWNNKS